MAGAVGDHHRARHRAALGLRFLILLGFAVFFALPVIWLVIAPTKTGDDLIFRSPLAIGSFHNVWAAWQEVDGMRDHVFRRWVGNSLYYSLSATAIVLATAIPAGYGLAFGNFPGRKLLLTLTLVSMIMPSGALVLPIFLELNSLRLTESAFAVILPFSFFPFGVYLAYIYYATAVPRDLL